jgi:predicted DNA-binding protein (UPF0278 family)
MSSENPVPSPEHQLAEHIMSAAAKQGVRAKVEINPMPPHIAANLMEFLRRVKCDGMEAIAWVEAYTFLQQHVPQQGQQSGIPFNGLPPKQG